MKIVYFTRALPDAVYEKRLREGEPLNNPSNQNFHSRLIASLRLNNEVEVASLKPYSMTRIDLEEVPGYTYIENRGKVAMLRNQTIEKMVPKADLVLFDSLAPRLGRMALGLAKKARKKALAIITDNPKNLANSTYLFQNWVFKNSKEADGAIALNEALSPSNKPVVLVPGIVKDEGAEPIKRDRPYIYFGGSLMKRYGLPNFLEAFLYSKLDVDFLIAGHHETKPIETNDKRVVYLGQVSEKENAAYQAGAALLVNPRPLEDKLDSESIPSKMFEYLVSGSPILSTRHPFFFESFNDGVNWVDENMFHGWLSAHTGPDGKLTEVTPNTNKEKTVNEYGLNAWSKRLSDYLATLISDSN